MGQYIVHSRIHGVTPGNGRRTFCPSGHHDPYRFQQGCGNALEHRFTQCLGTSESFSLGSQSHSPSRVISFHSELNRPPRILAQGGTLRSKCDGSNPFPRLCCCARPAKHRTFDGCSIHISALRPGAPISVRPDVTPGGTSSPVKPSTPVLARNQSGPQPQSQLGSQIFTIHGQTHPYARGPLPPSNARSNPTRQALLRGQCNRLIPKVEGNEAVLFCF